MISEELKKNINIINEEISKYTIMSKDDLFSEFIANRLKSILLEYQKDLEDTSNYLERQKAQRVIKALGRIQKNNDKDVILANLKKEEEN